MSDEQTSLHACSLLSAHDPQLSATAGPFLFGLAPYGVCPARCITAAAVRSCRTFSPLPRRYESFAIRRTSYAKNPSNRQLHLECDCVRPTTNDQRPTTTRRYVFCGTFRQPGLNPASRTLSGTLLCGVRTFLPPLAQQATVRSGCQPHHYIGSRKPACILDRENQPANRDVARVTDSPDLQHFGSTRRI